MVVVLENREYQEVIGNVAAPAINRLAARFGRATSSYATRHPSLPNYLELIAGTTFGIASDCTGCSVDGPTVVDQLAARGIGWRAYMEGMPSPCFTGASGGDGYAKKHDPFLYVAHLRESPGACRSIVPYDRLAGDLAQGAAPPFVWVTPNLCHDGHDCGISTVDAWLSRHLAIVMGSPWYAAGGAVVVTWDEGRTDAGCCAGARGGHTATLVVSARSEPGRVHAAPVDQAGILATVERAYGLTPLGDARCSCSGGLDALL